MAVPTDPTILAQSNLINSLSPDPMAAAQTDPTQAADQQPSMADQYKAFAAQQQSQQAGGYNRATSASPLTQAVANAVPQHAAVQQQQMMTMQQRAQGQLAPAQQAPQPTQPQQDWEKTTDGSRNVQMIRGGRESYYNTQTGQETDQPVATQAAAQHPQAQPQQSGFDAHGVYTALVKAGAKPDEAMKYTLTAQQHVADQQASQQRFDSRQGNAGGGRQPSFNTQTQADRFAMGQDDKAIKAYDETQKNPFQTASMDKDKLQSLKDQSDAATADKQQHMDHVNSIAGFKAPTPPKPGVKIDKANAMQFLQAAGGDRKKAEQLAAQTGWGL